MYHVCTTRPCRNGTREISACCSKYALMVRGFGERSELMGRDGGGDAPAFWTRAHRSSMPVCSRSKTHTMQATAPLLNCMRSCSCRPSSSSQQWSNVARNSLALSLSGVGGGGAVEWIEGGREGENGLLCMFHICLVEIHARLGSPKSA